MKRKTISILSVIEKVNRNNRESTCSPDLRHGWNDLLEEMLIWTDLYCGFVFLKADEVPPGHKPGIVPDPTGGSHHRYPDDSRRHYLIDQSLTSAKRS